MSESDQELYTKWPVVYDMPTDTYRRVRQADVDKMEAGLRALRHIKSYVLNIEAEFTAFTAFCLERNKTDEQA